MLATEAQVCPVETWGIPVSREYELPNSVRWWGVLPWQETEGVPFIAVCTAELAAP
jgi:hypothetical protein